jgi:hypothetical protein
MVQQLVHIKLLQELTLGNTDYDPTDFETGTQATKSWKSTATEQSLAT